MKSKRPIWLLLLIGISRTAILPIVLLIGWFLMMANEDVAEKFFEKWMK